MVILKKTAIEADENRGAAKVKTDRFYPSESPGGQITDKLASLEKSVQFFECN